MSCLRCLIGAPNQFYSGGYLHQRSECVSILSSIRRSAASGIEGEARCKARLAIQKQQRHGLRAVNLNAAVDQPRGTIQ